jgi:Glycosyltransferase family 87
VLNTWMLRRLTRSERLLIALILVGFVAFGILVEYRSAFLRRRMGDVGVYLRAAWCVRSGGEALYTFADDNGWHYHYPPLFAVLLVPLADPPRRDLALTASTTVGTGGPLQAISTLAAAPAPLTPDVGPCMPFPVSVAIFYLLSLGSLALGVHLLASALERVSAQPGVNVVSPNQRRWWWLRLWPVLICATPIGHTLMRGQANLFLLVAVCGATAALMDRKRFQAGLWLAGAICLKLFPGYLLVVPLLRRDARTLLGCAVGLFVGLFVIPGFVLGPMATLRCYAEQLEVLVRPALNLGGNGSARADELLDVKATDNQSYQAILHGLRYLGEPDRPNVAAPWVRYGHWVLAALFTLLTLLAVRRQARGFRTPPLLEPLVMGCLTLVMIQTSPVCHLHYFALALPVVMGLIAVGLERPRWDGWSWWLAVVFAAFFVIQTLPVLPSMDRWRDLGAASLATLGLGAVACGVLIQQRAQGPATENRLASRAA